MSVSGYHGGAVAHRGTAGAPVIFVVEDDWRTRHFICTVLKYSARALVIEFSSPHDALAVARERECDIDMLIASLDWDDAKTGLDAAHEIAARNPSVRVLLLSGRRIPPRDIPAAWKFLPIPFPTAALLNCVNQTVRQPE